MMTFKRINGEYIVTVDKLNFVFDTLHDAIEFIREVAE